MCFDVGLQYLRTAAAISQQHSKLQRKRPTIQQQCLRPRHVLRQHPPPHITIRLDTCPESVHVPFQQSLILQPCTHTLLLGDVSRTVLTTRDHLRTTPSHNSAPGDILSKRYHRRVLSCVFYCKILERREIYNSTTI